MSKDDERVLCVPTEALRNLFGGTLFHGYWAGRLNTDKRDVLEIVLREGVAKFVRRGDCEQDPSLKQIIPYVMLTCNAYGQRQVFRYNRLLRGGGESRLAGKATIGIGGHINDADHRGDFYETFQAAWRREVNEEVKIDSAYKCDIKGLLNDDTDEVGRVHLGVLIELQLKLPCVYPNEPDIVQPHFMPLAFSPLSWSEASLNFEGWSEIALQKAL